MTGGIVIRTQATAPKQFPESVQPQSSATSWAGSRSRPDATGRVDLTPYAANCRMSVLRGKRHISGRGASFREKNAAPGPGCQASCHHQQGVGNNMEQHHANSILRLAQVLEITGLGRSTIYDLIRRGEFPSSRQLGRRAVGWISSEIFQWVASRNISRKGG